MTRKKTHDDEGLLAEVRRRRRCEFCHRGTPGGADPHHIWPRGMGSGSRMDVPFNLIALCRECHNKVGTGQIKRGDKPGQQEPTILGIVEKREGMTRDEIIRQIGRLKYGR